ncbi:MAG: hypothetical protein WCA78_04795 [Rhizomicrobium sp.]
MPLSDDELVAKVRSNIRIEGRMYWSVLVTFLIISALFAGILEFHLPMESTGMAALAVLLLWIAFVFRIQRTVQPVAGPIDEKTLRKTIDDQHRRWRWIYAFVFCMVAALAAMIIGVVLYIVAHARARSGLPFVGHPLFIPGPMVGILVLVVDFAFFAVTAAFQVCFGPGFLAGARRRALNDEHTRALQHSAAMFGYLLCVILMCAVLGAMTFSPLLGLVAMPGAIAAIVILPGIYFLFLQWRAGRNG